MSESTRPRGVHGRRRWFQAASLVLFLTLLTLTVWPLGQVFLGAFLVTDPLIALNSAVNGVVVGPLVVAAVLMLVAPLFVGRGFCGYLCPTGALIEWLSPSQGHGRLSPSARSALRKAPAFVLIAAGGLAVFASGIFLLFDPLATLTRTATLLLYPLVDRVLRVVADVLYLAPPARIPVDFLNNLAAGTTDLPAAPRLRSAAVGPGHGHGDGRAVMARAAACGAATCAHWARCWA